MGRQDWNWLTLLGLGYVLRTKAATSLAAGRRVRLSIGFALDFNVCGVGMSPDVQGPLSGERREGSYDLYLINTRVDLGRRSSQEMRS